MKKYIIHTFLLLLTLVPLNIWAQESVPDEVWDVGVAIETSINRFEKGYLDSLFSIQDLFEKKIKQKADGDNRITEFNKGFGGRVFETYSYGQQLITEAKKGASFVFLHAYQEVDNPKVYYLIFRLFSEDTGLNYHRIILKKGEKGYYIDDVYLFITGELLSRTLKRLYIGGLVSLLNDSGDINKYAQLTDLKKLLAAEQYQAAFDLFESLKETFAKDKAVRITGIRIAGNLSDKVYSNVLKEYEKDFPNDPSLYLMMIDAYILKKKYKKALAAIDKLEELVLGDELLDYLRGNIYVMMSDYESAISYFKAAAGNFPDYTSIYIQLIYTLSLNKQYEEGLGVVKSYITRFEVSKDDMDVWVQANCPGLANSEVYFNWLYKKDKN